MEVLSSIINSSFANDYLKIIGSQLNVDRDLLSCLKQYLLKSDFRKRGLIFLNTFISQCTSDTVNEHAVFWIDTCLKESKSEDVSTQINSFNILSKILHVSDEYPDLYKRISTDYLSKIIDDIYIVKPGVSQSLSALNCLRICLKIFPGTCGHHRSNIEKYIFSYIDSTNPNEIYLISQCFHYIPQISGSGPQGSIHKAQWISQQIHVCVTLHSILNDLFEYIDEMNNIEINNADQLELPEISDGGNKVIQIYKLANRFNNCANLLQTMLIEPFPTSKRISLDKIIDVISRTFSINGDVIKKDSLDDFALGTVITTIHNNTLQLLEALVFSVGTNILPYAAVISKILIDVLENTNLELSPERSSILLKIQAYKSLSNWLSSAQGASCISLFSDVLVPIIINDLTYNKVNCIVITQNNKPVTLKSKKKHQLKESNYLTNRVEHVNNRSDHSSQKLNDLRTELSFVALKTIQHLLESQSVLLQPLIHKVLQEILVKQILDLKKKSEFLLYQSKLCCKQLYRTLIALVVNFHPTMPPPTFCVLDILSSGQKDKDFEISQICTNGLLILEKIIHPPIPTFYLLNQKENPNYVVEFKENSKKRKCTDNNYFEQSSDVLVTTVEISDDSNMNGIVEINSNDSDGNSLPPPEDIHVEVVDKDIEIVNKDILAQIAAINSEQNNKESFDRDLNCKPIESEKSNLDINQDEALSSKVSPENEIWESQTEILTPSDQHDINIEKDIANLHDLHENFNSQEPIEYVSASKRARLSDINEQSDIKCETQIVNEIKECNGSDKLIDSHSEKNENVVEAHEDNNELDAMLSTFVDVVQ